MCLVVVAWRQDPDCPLIVAGNRDEFHARAAAPAAWWDDPPGILGGRDLEAGGTWLALAQNGRFAVVTNYREGVVHPPGLRSRGFLVTDYLESHLPAPAWLRGIDGAQYAGFNLFAFDGETLAFGSNRGAKAVALEAGIYGLANAELDAPWTKVVRARRRMSELVGGGRPNEASLFEMLDDREPGPPAETGDPELPPERARALTAPFVVTPDYGTRCSTVVRAFADGRWTLAERRFAADGSETGRSGFSVL